MKKALLKIITALICVCFALSAFACKSSAGFDKTTLKSWGAVEGNYGFVSSTENYVYFINGLGSSTADNTYGAPIKGTLMVAAKDDLSAAQIAVPKLFVASDYASGIFVAGSGEETYVYYGTPNTEKNSSGSVANTELVFMKTRLDGENTTKLVTVDSLSTEYRFVSVGDTVYLIYKQDDKLVEYNTATKTSKTIIEKDLTKQESLDTIYLIKDATDGGYTAVYTVNCYNGEYVSDDTRTKHLYNKVYAYKAGSDPELILNGKTKNETYKPSVFKGKYLFFTVTEEGSSNEISYIKDVASGEVKKMVNTSYTVSDVLIVSWDEIYVADTDGGCIYKTSFITNEKTAKEIVVRASVSKVLFISGDKIYYSNSDNKVARSTLGVADTEVIVVNESVYFSWYAPKLVGNDFFFMDNDYYIKAIDVSSNGTYDAEKDITTLGDATFIGKKTAVDEGTFFANTVKDIYIEKDGKVTDESINAVQAVYNATSEAGKKEISTDDYNKLENYKKAYDIAKKFEALNGIAKYGLLSESEKTAIKSKYDEAKAAVNALSDEDTIVALISDNLNWNYYTKGAELFETAE